MENNKLDMFMSVSFGIVKRVIVKYKYTFLFSISFSLIYVLPLLLANVYYLDDLPRSIFGFGWTQDNRYISTFIMSKLTLGGFITDYFPYSIIFAAIIVAISGYILVSILNLEEGRQIKLSALILLINPFFLENLSFRWDAIPMAISIFCVIVPFKFMSSNRLFILFSTLGVCVTMLTYQASVPIYILVALTVLINKCMNGNKDIFRSLVLFCIGFLPGIIIYKLVTLNADLGIRESIIPFNGNFFNILSYNIRLSTDFILSAFSRYFTALVILSILFGLLGFSKLIKSDKPMLNKFLAVMFSFFVIIFMPITILILEKIYLGGRILVTFPFLIYLIFIFANNFSRNIISGLSLLFILVSFALMSSYANALKAQNGFDINVFQKIAQTVDLEAKKIVFIGQIEYAPEVFYTVEKFPIFKYMIPSYAGYGWGMMYFTHRNNYLYNIFTLTKEEERLQIAQNKETVPIIDETYYYVLRADSSRVIIDFDESVSKKQKIKFPF